MVRLMIKIILILRFLKIVNKFVNMNYLSIMSLFLKTLPSCAPFYPRFLLDKIPALMASKHPKNTPTSFPGPQIFFFFMGQNFTQNPDFATGCILVLKTLKIHQFSIFLCIWKEEVISCPLRHKQALWVILGVQEPKCNNFLVFF